MPEIVNIHAAKTQLSRLVERAHQGEEIILAKAGKPYARLVPLAPFRTREFGFLAGTVQLSDEEQREIIRPLSESEEARSTRLSDLAIVCANCHVMIHRGGGCRAPDELIVRPRQQ